MRLFLIFLLVIPGFADFNRTSRIIDVPHAKILPHLGYRIGFDGSFALDFDRSAEKFDENLHASIGFGNAVETYFDIYTFKNFTAAFGFCHRFYEARKLTLGWGIHQISYDLDISEVGHGDSISWDDDLDYATRPDYKKPFELGSAFMVSTYSPSKFLDFTIGLGRGKYVGYGPNSKHFNSEFYHEKGGDWAVGLLLGFAIKPVKNFSFLFDLDGRDINAGFRFRYLPLEFCFAVVKVEQFAQAFSPRISASISYIKDKKTSQKTIIKGVVVDKEDGRPLGAEVNILHRDVPNVITKPEVGTFCFANLTADVYEIYAVTGGYIGKKKKVKAKAGKTVYVDFELDKKKEEAKTGDLFGSVRDRKTGEPIDATLTIEEIGKNYSCGISGIFQFKNLEPNVYKIKAEAYDYETGYYPAVVNVGERNETEIFMIKRGMVITLKGIQFDFNKVTIKPESHPILDEAAAILTNHPEINVEIQGHTCSVGSDAYNLNLSKGRANSVRSYLIQQHNIEPSRLRSRGYGERRPIADNRSEAGRIQNRRVDFVILR